MNEPVPSDPARRSADPSKAGRPIDVDDHGPRNSFQRDRDRIIHTKAFRRLGEKTQVFSPSEGDHFRNRLTHTLAVAQIARTLASSLKIDENLTEAIALAHDLGHPPFGHAGERALKLIMESEGGFDHNFHSFMIVTRLEHIGFDFDGLNLTWQTLDGILKHNGPKGAQRIISSLSPDLPPKNALYQHAKNGIRRTRPCQINPYPFQLSRHTSLEGQCAAIADDIAWVTHDIDDGLRAQMLSVDMLMETELGKDVINTRVRDADLQAPPDRTIRGPDYEDRLYPCIFSALVDVLVLDVLEEAEKRLNDHLELYPPNTESDQSVVTFSCSTSRKVTELKEFQQKYLWNNSEIKENTNIEQKAIEELFRAIESNPGEADLRDDTTNQIPLRRRICNHIAGMTDRFAVACYESATGNTFPSLRVSPSRIP